MNYHEQLKQNREKNGQATPPWKAEWDILLQTKFFYDEKFDYVYEGGTLNKLMAEYRRDGMDKNDIEAVALSVLTQQPTPISNCDKHKLSWVYWVDYEKKNFIRNWKPKDDAGLNYMWLHYQFHEDTPIETVKVDMERIVNLAVFKKCKLTYVYEYYTSNGQKSHPHVHMLVELNRTGTICPSTLEAVVFQDKQLRKYLILTWYYSWATGDNIRKRCPKRPILEAYINGNKVEKKEGDVEQDRLWRKNNNLEDKYIKDNT